jgi:hypothetical protein
MSNGPAFFATRMGARFYEATMPELVKQLARLNDNLEALLQRLPPPPPPEESKPK